MNVLIVEDEQHTARLLQEIIEKQGEFLVVEIVDSIVQAVNFLAKHQDKLDLMFFDIHLADGLSFEIFNHIEVSTPIIFCTAYDEYALKAIKSNGIDYILKPYEDQEIESALKKYESLVTRITPKYSSFLKSRNTYQQHFLCQSKEQTILIRAKNIVCFSYNNQNTYIYTFDRKRYHIFMKLEQLEAVVDPDSFFRINRQVIVSKNGVVSYEPYFNRKIILKLSIEVDERPIVSRLKVSDFKKWLISSQI
jgi:two-component system response regulator LytT